MSAESSPEHAGYEQDHEREHDTDDDFSRPPMPDGFADHESFDAYLRQPADLSDVARTVATFLQPATN